jgi:hypothetical protein
MELSYLRTSIPRRSGRPESRGRFLGRLHINKPLRDKPKRCLCLVRGTPVFYSLVDTRRFWLLRAFLLVLCPAQLASCQMRGAQTAQSPLLRFFERDSGLISYIAADGNIAVVDQRGGRAKALTTGAGKHEGISVYYTAPTWSPDARKMAFAQITLLNENTLLDASLYTTDPTGGQQPRLLSGKRLRPIYLFWSPDSRIVSLLSQVQGERALELGVATADGPGSNRGIDQGMPYYWDWLKDSRSIVVHTNLLPNRRHRRTAFPPSCHRSGPPAPTSPFETGMFQAPNVSPDGKNIAYVSTTSSGFVLHMRTLNGSAERVLARDLGGAFFSFSADGKRMAYLATRVAEPIPLGRLTILDVQGNLSERTIVRSPFLVFCICSGSLKAIF